MKQAEYPTAKSCSGFVPGLLDPGGLSCTSSAPSLLRPVPSRPLVVWVLAV